MVESVSASSGIQHVSGNENILLKNKLQNIIKNCIKFVITGFTEKEAKEYFASLVEEANPNDEKTKTVSFEEVYPFTGYNPYLLSIVKNMPSKGRAEAVVDSYVRDYMCGNLSVFDNNEVLSTYLQTQELQDTLEFSYYACRSQLTKAEEDKFDKIWLAKHYLAVVETRNTETVEIVPDQETL